MAVQHNKLNSDGVQHMKIVRPKPGEGEVSGGAPENVSGGVYRHTDTRALTK